MHLPHRAALRLQPHDLAAVLVDMIKGTLVGALIGLPLAALILWIMGATGRCGGCGPGRLVVSTCCCWCCTRR
jgi:Na+/citrate or Na+/malate symporter